MIKFSLGLPGYGILCFSGEYKCWSSSFNTSVALPFKKDRIFKTSIYILLVYYHVFLILILLSCIFFIKSCSLIAFNIIIWTCSHKCINSRFSELSHLILDLWNACFLLDWALLLYFLHKHRCYILCDNTKTEQIF